MAELAAGGHGGGVNRVSAARLLGRGEGGVDAAGRDRAQSQGGAALRNAGQQVFGLAQLLEHPDGGLTVSAAEGFDDAPVGMAVGEVALEGASLRYGENLQGASRRGTLAGVIGCLLWIRSIDDHPDATEGCRPTIQKSRKVVLGSHSATLVAEASRFSPRRTQKPPGLLAIRCQRRLNDDRTIAASALAKRPILVSG